MVCGLQEIGREFGNFSISLASYRLALSPRRRLRLCMHPLSFLTHSGSPLHPLEHLPRLPLLPLPPLTHFLSAFLCPVPFFLTLTIFTPFSLIIIVPVFSALYSSFGVHHLIQ